MYKIKSLENLSRDAPDQWHRNAVVVTPPYQRQETLPKDLEHEAYMPAVASLMDKVVSEVNDGKIYDVAAPSQILEQPDLVDRSLLVVLGPFLDFYRH
eukprot:CAMPEP_0198724362 /NCGR_PEP_ID=MMETSP1475-20131203/1844_1 /TAXON_ID= ORGANISM="Unidentified sp., Strain CCMP1999" /NCGR_SAMPLE_ID=MMETSP1475 /ASSEMBLY_ACC=CAM_ASM_001111 /LENGTH=97 /DNA_ID=CAMNT_0044485863 /DNA_START=1204 /DNA_END=1497 /DNA_ORIENTATION=+